MLTVIAILLIIAAILLIIIILAQNPKGGGLSSSFGGTSQIIGARQTADFLEKATWYIAIGILVVVLSSNFFIPNGEVQEDKKSIMSEKVDQMANPMPPAQTGQTQNQTQTQDQQTQGQNQTQTQQPQDQSQPAKK